MVSPEPPTDAPAALLPPRMLFRYSVPCHRHDQAGGQDKLDLAAKHRLVDLQSLDGEIAGVDLRAAWSENGLTFTLRVQGKRLPPRCRLDRITESDSLQIWIDTRATHNIDRASRFCHHFVFLSTGSGKRRNQPWAEQMAIARAKQEAPIATRQQLYVRAEKRVDGYLLEAAVPSAALEGFDPAEHPRLGFTYLVRDAELGDQTFSCGGEFPYQADPSLWATLELA